MLQLLHGASTRQRVSCNDNNGAGCTAHRCITSMTGSAGADEQK